MVKVFGPAMSLDASGSLANTITFSKWKGRNYVRERVIPSNPKSGAQTGRRAMFKFLTQNWAALSAGEKSSWQTLADELVASPFNAYIKYNMMLWHNFLTPTQDAGYERLNNGSDRTLSAAVWEENRIKISSTATAAAEQWGLIIFASTSTPITEAVGNAIIVGLDLGVGQIDWFWTPPTVTTWYFDSIAFSDDGIAEAAGGEVNAAP